MVYDIDERYWDEIVQSKAGPTEGMKSYDLRTFKAIVESSDIIYGGVRLNAAQSLKARVRKKSLLAALNTIDERPYQAFYARMEVDRKGRRILTLTI